MKVVFLETVEGSGSMGEVRDVANGYARNYLLPRGFAAPATSTLLRRAEELARIEEERQRAQEEHAHELVGKLDEVTLVMTARVGEQGRLYGSVTNNDIAEKAGEILGEELDRRRVLLPEVIRSVGLYTVPLRLSRNVIPEVRVAVVDAEAPEGVEAAVQMLLAPLVEEPLAEDITTAEARAVDGSSEPDAEGVPESGDTTADETASDATEAPSDASEAATEEAETTS